jgi:hypothetical protein
VSEEERAETPNPFDRLEPGRESYAEPARADQVDEQLVACARGVQPFDGAGQQFVHLPTLTFCGPLAWGSRSRLSRSGVRR